MNLTYVQLTAFLEQALFNGICGWGRAHIGHTTTPKQIIRQLLKPEGKIIIDEDRGDKVVSRELTREALYRALEKRSDMDMIKIRLGEGEDLSAKGDAIIQEAVFGELRYA